MKAKLAKKISNKVLANDIVVVMLDFIGNANRTKLSLRPSVNLKTGAIMDAEARMKEWLEETLDKLR